MIKIWLHRLQNNIRQSENPKEVQMDQVKVNDSKIDDGESTKYDDLEIVLSKTFDEDDMPQ
jgi:hypothetical protein